MTTPPCNPRSWIVRSSTALVAAFALPALGNVPCNLGRACTDAPAALADLRTVLSERTADIEYATTMHVDRASYRSALPRSEYRAFGGIGTIVCNVDGASRASTAFLVGRFDIAVTVAHTFKRDDGEWVSPESCTYLSSDSAGGIRERIAVASFMTQWQSQPDTAGQPTADLAVARLTAPVRTALRTLPFTKFARAQAPVALIGYRSDLSVDLVRRKALGTVYRRTTRSCAPFLHNADSRRISPGAPIIDVRDGVVIGVHTQLRKRSGCRPAGNAMIVMTPWLEHTLRAEIEAPSEPMPKSQAAQSP